jgi:histidine triad (HIT) family protein
MADCIFCKIIAGEIPADKVYEDEKTLAFLDIAPVNPGHTLLIPKEHYENLYELPDEVLSGMAPILKKIAIAVKQGMKADGLNTTMHNGKAAGQVVSHAHFHIIPRISGDGLPLWPQKSYAEGEAKEVAEKIREQI